jgi:hypothetical protein
MITTTEYGFRTMTAVVVESLASPHLVSVNDCRCGIRRIIIIPIMEMIPSVIPRRKQFFKNIATPPPREKALTKMMMTTTTLPLKDHCMPMEDYETSHRSH